MLELLFKTPPEPSRRTLHLIQKTQCDQPCTASMPYTSSPFLYANQRGWEEFLFPHTTLATLSTLLIPPQNSCLVKTQIVINAAPGTPTWTETATGTQHPSVGTLDRATDRAVGRAGEEEGLRDRAARWTKEQRSAGQIERPETDPGGQLGHPRGHATE